MSETEQLFFSMPESHYTAIGKVAANWAGFEKLVESALWVLADVNDEPGVCLTSQIPNMASRFDALISIAGYRGIDENIIKKIKQFSKSTFDLNSKRNRIIHDPWHWNVTTQRALRLETSADKRLSFGFVAMSEAEIIKIVDEIATHMNNFNILVREASGAMSPLPHKRL